MITVESHLNNVLHHSYNAHGITIMVARTNDFRCGSTVSFLAKYVRSHTTYILYQLHTKKWKPVEYNCRVMN